MIFHSTLPPKKYVMDSRFSVASRNTRYFRALEDNEMLEKLQSEQEEMLKFTSRALLAVFLTRTEVSSAQP